MKKIAIAIILICLMTLSCSSYQKALNSIPQLEAEYIKYQRGGMFSSALILCEGVHKFDNGIMIDRIQIVETTPWFNISFEMKKYFRKAE